MSNIEKMCFVNWRSVYVGKKQPTKHAPFTFNGINLIVSLLAHLICNKVYSLIDVLKL